MKAEKNSITRLCVSAASGSGGKTLLSLGLGRAFANRGLIVQPFKKGPDYIDAAWLSTACRRACSNLDPFFQDASGLAETFHAALTRSAKMPALALMEGNRGLYDGLDETGSCSTAAVARALDLPVLLCLNAAKSTRTVAALVQGLVNFEKGLRFCGLVLNNVGSARHETALAKTLAANTDLALLGILPRLRKNPLPERHMGLATFNAARDEEADRIFEALAALVEENCNLEDILVSASAAVAQDDSGQAGNILEIDTSVLSRTDSAVPGQSAIKRGRQCLASAKQAPIIGYVRDAAFWFYYPENLEALLNAGAILRELSMLEAWQKEKWEDLDGLYLGGGFPEDYAQFLASSPALLFISNSARNGMPIYAECGGLALLCRELQIRGTSWRMAGLFDVSLCLHERPQGLGYVEGRVTAANPFFPVGHVLRGHEFHYTSCSAYDNLRTALELGRGQGLAKNARDAIIYKNVWASYTHIFAPSQPGWAPAFVETAREWRAQKENLA